MSTTKTFAEVQTEDRRLTLLLGLVECAQWTGNIYLLQSFCASLGHSVGLDRLETDLAWLEEQGLLKTDKHSGVTVAMLTRRGEDVARGRSAVPGVKRPVPGA